MIRDIRAYELLVQFYVRGYEFRSFEIMILYFLQFIKAGLPQTILYNLIQTSLFT